MSPRVAYSPAQKAEAVALARVMGSELASEKTGIPWRTIRTWSEQAGAAPEVAAPRDAWERLLDKAMTVVNAALDSGTLKPAQVATVAAIATRNIREEKPTPPESATAAKEAFYDWLIGSMTVIDETAAADALGELQRELLRRANSEGGPDRHSRFPEPVGPHRSAALAWYSGRAEVEAGDVLDWAKAQTTAILAEHGTLEAWHAWRIAEDAKPKPLPPHIASLIAQAQAFLEETSDAA